VVKRKIIWSTRSRIRLYEILDFYIERNKSKSYSIKLYKLISREVKLLQKYPEMGIKTTDVAIRGLIIENYILYYEISEDAIIIHTIWDNRQNPSGKTFKDQ
jgi:plasmid stabilization system protein ParE